MDSVWRLLIGPPLRAREVSRERITPVEGLSALSLDALTSVAYGPEAIIVVLAVAGAGALHLVLPITVTIVILLAILVFSYRQVIDAYPGGGGAYPGGGGAYAVSRANLGAWAGLVAAGALVVDYTLTVAVSIAAGVAAMTSAFPGLGPATVPICLAILAVVTLLNLRGLGDAARAFLLPTMVFIVGLLAIIVIGLIHPLALHAPQPGHSLIPTPALETVSVLLLLKAFSAGCSALTGVEAIANGCRCSSSRAWRGPNGPSCCSAASSARCCSAWRCWPACSPGTTTCRTCSSCATTGRCSRRGSGRWLSWPAHCSSPWAGTCSR